MAPSELNTQSPLNRRGRERLAAHLPLELILPEKGGATREPAISRDLSSQGVYCYLRRKVPAGSRVELEMAGRFQPAGRQLSRSSLVARVVRTDWQEGFGLYGVALCFLEEEPFFGH